jgi:ABC-2 type transport system ATP-binding protein
VPERLPAVEARELGKGFHGGSRLGRILGRPTRRTPIEALGSLSFSLAPQELVALVGPNGAGKSTLLRILATLLLPDSGGARVAGHDVIRDDVRVRRCVAFVGGDDRSSSLRLSGRENLEFVAALHGVDRSDRHGRVATALDAVGLTAAADDAYSSYSTGMRQRLGIARALVTDASVLLLDEPFRALDAESAGRLRRTLADVRARGATVLVATHHLDELEGEWDRVLALEGGRLVYDGTVEAYAR